MINLLNKSVKSIYQNLSSQEPRPLVSLIKITSISLPESNTIPNISHGDEVNKDNNLAIILLIKTHIYIFLLQPTPILDFKCIFKHNFNFPINDIDTVNTISRYVNDIPLMALTSNSTIPYENQIKFYSVFNKNIVHYLRFKYMINKCCLNKKYFGVGCFNGKIYIYNNQCLELVYKVSIKDIKIVGMNPKNSSEWLWNNKNSWPNKNTTMSVMIDKNNSRRSFGEVEDNTSNTMMKSAMIKGKDFAVVNNNINNWKNSKITYNTVFDLSENYIYYYIQKKKIIGLKGSDPWRDDLENQNSENTTLSPWESFALDTYKNLSKLKEWSFKSIKELNQLRKSSNAKSNFDFISNSSSSLSSVVSYYNISDLDDKQTIPKWTTGISNMKIILPQQLKIPFFKDGISFISQIQSGKYLIIGNNHNQMFFIFELFAQTNKQYNFTACIGQTLNQTSSIWEYKIIYSLFRGIRATQIASVDMNKTYNYVIITSSRGTNHWFSLNKRDNQIIENIFEENKNNEHWINMKIINGDEVYKVTYTYYNNTNNTRSIYNSRLVTIENVYLENNFSSDNALKINEVFKDKFISTIKNGNYALMVNDNIVNISWIINSENIIPLKQWKLQLNEDKENILQNISLINKGVYNINSIGFGNNKKEQGNNGKNVVDFANTTNISCFSIIQINPLFTYNKYLAGTSQAQIGKIKKTEDCPLIIVNQIDFSILCSVGISLNDQMKSFSLFQASPKTYNSIFNSDIALYENLCNDKEYISVRNGGESIRRSNVFKETISAKKLIINPNYDSNNSMDIKTNFYSNKDNILENNIKSAMNSNIKDLINTQNSVEKKEKLVIQDDYY